MSRTTETRRQPVGAGVAEGGRRWAPDASTPGPRTAGSSSSAPTGPQILVVDDDADVRMLLTMYLALDGFVAEEADSAAGAVEAIRRRRPDLVLLDVMMP